LFFIFMIPEILSLTEGIKISVPVLSDIPYSDRLIILLTFAITIFTMVGSYSTYLQVVFAQASSRIEDARNELEKAYGPLYTILNCPISETATYIRLRRKQKVRLDYILATYPFMFTTEIVSSWKEKVQQIPPAFLSEEIAAGVKIPLYHIPIEFRNKVNEEYRHRVERYDKLLGKDRGLQSTGVQKMSEDAKRQEEQVKRQRALDFYMGVAIAILGGFFVSCLIELTNNIWSIEPSHGFIIDWAIMFILSDLAFWQFVKFGMKGFVGSDHRLKYFDYCTIFFTLLGFSVIALARFSLI